MHMGNRDHLNHLKVLEEGLLIVHISIMNYTGSNGVHWAPSSNINVEVGSINYMTI